MKQIGRYRIGFLVFLISWMFLWSQASHAAQVDAGNTAVIINLDDPLSMEIGKYYIEKRHIPPQNVIRINIGSGRDIVPEAEFKKIAPAIEQQTGKHIQAYLLAWSRPYRAGCMSITSAISLGYDTSYCAKGCRPTRQIDYFNSDSRQPFRDYHIRPSMMLAADDLEEARKLIDRGVSADYSRATGDAYLLDTSDKQRNVRSVNYALIKQKLGNVASVKIVKANAIHSRDKVLFYFTGVKRVSDLDSIEFVPGAVADHLTSSGGVLFGKEQMSSLEWLRAGATASYGAVVEPCNYLAKFPNPGVFMERYLNGDTLLEAYWKSVAMPGQGVFVGEPLASPYRGCRLLYSKDGRAIAQVNRKQELPFMLEAARCGL